MVMRRAFVSSLVSLYTLILLLFPSSFLLSPVLFSVAVILLSLLRLGASHTTHQNQPPQIISVTLTTIDPDPDPDSTSCGSFVEWDVGAPLEIIHEGEEDADHSSNDAVSVSTPEYYSVHVLGGTTVLLHRYPSLSRYYPETDSDSDSDSDSSCSMEGVFPAIGGSDCSPESFGFGLAGEEIDGEKDGLIEIQLDADCATFKKKVVEDMELSIGEDNFIEIDISPVTGGNR